MTIYWRPCNVPSNHINDRSGVALTAMVKVFGRPRDNGEWVLGEEHVVRLEAMAAVDPDGPWDILVEATRAHGHIVVSGSGSSLL